MDYVIEDELPANPMGHRVLYDEIGKYKYYFVKFTQGGVTKDQYIYVTGRNDAGAGMIVYDVIAERPAGGSWVDLEDYKEDVTRAQVNNAAYGISAHFYVPGMPTASPSTVSRSSSRSGSTMNDPRIQRALIATAPNDRYRILFHSNNPRFTVRTRIRARIRGRRRPITRRGRRGIAIMERTRRRRRRHHA